MKKLLTALSILLGVILGGASVTFATLRVVQTPTYHLYTGESGTATTMRITPFPTDLDGVKLTITDLGTTPTVTVDPKISGIEEIESFTGITDNGDNTATLTGVSRDLQSKYPYTGTGTGRTHSSGATVVFGNNPQIYGRLAAPENDQTWTGTQTFSGQTNFSATNIPVYSSTPTFGSNGNVLVNKAYVDSGILNGAATSTFSNQGLVQLATDLQVSNSTASSTSGSPLVIPSKNATSTYNPSTARLGMIPTLRATKDIDPNFVATSSANTYNYGAAMNFNATTTFGNGFIDTASSTIMATTTFIGPLLNAGLVTAFTAGETLAAGTPVTVATTTSNVYKALANTASSTQYIGITKTAATVGQTVYVQTTGVITGLTGLTANRDYYSSDTATLQTTIGTLEVFVGKSLTTTSLLIDTGRANQYNGTVSISAGTFNVPAYTRTIIMPSVSVSYANAVGPGESMVFNINGANSASAAISSCCALNTASFSMSWTPPTTIGTGSLLVGSIGGNATGGSGTAYFYR